MYSIYTCVNHVDGRAGICIIFNLECFLQLSYVLLTVYFYHTRISVGAHDVHAFDYRKVNKFSNTLNLVVLAFSFFSTKFSTH